MITLGFVVAIGLPLMVLVLAVLWPERSAEVPDADEGMRSASDPSSIE